MGPGKMVPFQSLTQSLFAALVSGRGCSSIGNTVSHQHHAGCQLRTGQQRTAGSSCPGLPASGRLRPPARTGQAEGSQEGWPRPMAIGSLALHKFHAVVEEQMDGPGNPPNAR